MLCQSDVVREGGQGKPLFRLPLVVNSVSGLRVFPWLEGQRISRRGTRVWLEPGLSVYRQHGCVQISFYGVWQLDSLPDCVCNINTFIKETWIILFTSNKGGKCFCPRLFVCLLSCNYNNLAYTAVFNSKFHSVIIMIIIIITEL